MPRSSNPNSSKTPPHKRKNPGEQFDTFNELLMQATPLQKKQKRAEKGVKLTFEDTDKENKPSGTTPSLTTFTPHYKKKSLKKSPFSQETNRFLSDDTSYFLRSNGDNPQVRKELLEYLEQPDSHQSSPLAWRFNPDHEFHLLQCTYNESTHRWYTNKPEVTIDRHGRPSFDKNGQSYLGCDDILTIVTPDKAKHKIWVMRQQDKIEQDSNSDIDLIQSQLLNTPPELLDTKEIAVRVKTRDLAHRDANKRRAPNPKTFHDKKTANDLLNEQLQCDQNDDSPFAQFDKSFKNPFSAEYVHFLGRRITPISPTRTAFRINQERSSSLEALLYENGKEVINAQFSENFGTALRGHNTKQLVMETLIANIVEYRADQQQDKNYEPGIEVIVRVTTQKERNIPLQVVIGFLDPKTQCFFYQNNCEPLRTERPCDIRKALTDFVTTFLENYDKQAKPLCSPKRP